MKPLKPSLAELREICRTMLRLAPALNVNQYVGMIENGVNDDERLGWMLAHVAVSVTLVDGLHPDSDAFAMLMPEVEKSGASLSGAREALKAIETALLTRLRALYPRLDINALLATLDEMPALEHRNGKRKTG